MVTVPWMIDNSDEAGNLNTMSNEMLRPNILLQSHNFLAYECGNLHMVDQREATRAKLLKIVGEISSRGTNHDTISQNPDPIRHDAVERSRSSLPAIKSVLLPDKECVDNYPTDFLTIDHPYAKAMPTFFPSGEGDYDSESRQIQVSEVAFVNHYIRYARKELAEFSPFVFYSLYRIETKRVTASEHALRGYV